MSNLTRQSTDDEIVEAYNTGTPYDAIADATSHTYEEAVAIVEAGRDAGKLELSPEEVAKLESEKSASPEPVVSVEEKQAILDQVKADAEAEVKAIVDAAKADAEKVAEAAKADADKVKADAQAAADAAAKAAAEAAKAK